MARPKCGTPIVLFAFFLLKSGGKKKPRTFMLLPPSQPQVVFSFRQAYLSQQSAFFLQRKRSAKQNKSCGFLFVFWRNKMLAMWINLHQVAYLGGISTTFPTLLEMLTPSNLSLLYVRYSHLIKTSACTRRTEQRRKIKACLENTFHDHKSLLTTCVTKSWPLSLSLSLSLSLYIYIYIYIYNLFSIYILIF